uniref:leucine-rich repeat and immunoglobulin-like domain-containing nogo receptor-interacting protein 1 isoform X1 n=2 Tax=Pristiophorus japonicus TaxID=55135 RepID=UPI00398EBEE6
MRGLDRVEREKLLPLAAGLGAGGHGFKMEASKAVHVLILLVCLCGCVQACPSFCDCSAGNGTVLCCGKELTAVPQGVPLEARALDLSRNLITSIRLGELGSLPELEELDLSDNLVSNIEPGAFDGIRGLRTLRLRNNRLKTIWPGVLGATANLTVLDLRDNPLVILLDGAFPELAGLRQLELGEGLLYVASGALVGLGRLQRLALGKANSSTLPTTALAHLRGLTSLRLGPLNALALQDNSFQGLRALRDLVMEGWPRLAALAPDSLYGLNLTSLAITRCNLTAVPDRPLRHLVYLRSLDLSHNPIAVIRGGMLGQLVRLGELRLAGGRLATIEPSAFRGLGLLRALDVSGNRLETLEESAFQSPGSLASLRLDGNPLACDCRLRWLSGRRAGPSFEGRQPACASPESARGEALGDLGPGRLACRGARIPGKGARQTAAVTEGETARLRCAAEGDPAPAVQWSTPGRRVLRGGDGGRLRVWPDGSLEVRYAQAQDAGTYRCTARNAAGNDTATAVLWVRVFQPTATLGPATRPPPALILDQVTLSVVLTMGTVCFVGVVVCCFSMLLFWSKVKGPIKRTSEVDNTVHSSGMTAQSEAVKYSTKML